MRGTQKGLLDPLETDAGSAAQSTALMRAGSWWETGWALWWMRLLRFPPEAKRGLPPGQGNPERRRRTQPRHRLPAAESARRGCERLALAPPCGSTRERQGWGREVGCQEGVISSMRPPSSAVTQPLTLWSLQWDIYLPHRVGAPQQYGKG